MPNAPVALHVRLVRPIGSGKPFVVEGFCRSTLGVFNRRSPIRCRCRAVEREVGLVAAASVAGLGPDDSDGVGEGKQPVSRFDAFRPCRQPFLTDLQDTKVQRRRLRSWSDNRLAGLVPITTGLPRKVGHEGQKRYVRCCCSCVPALGPARR